MEKSELDPGSEQKEKCGVLDYHIDNGQYVVDVRWKDGVRTTNHFPVAGFPIVDPVSGARMLKNMQGEKALELLKQHAAEYAYNDFSWIDFVDM